MITHRYINDLIQAERQAGTMPADVSLAIYDATSSKWMVMHPDIRLGIARAMLQATTSAESAREGAPPPPPVRHMVLSLLSGTPAYHLASVNLADWVTREVEAQWVAGAQGEA